MQFPKISIRIHPDDLEKLRSMAEKEGVKVSELIRRAIVDFLCKNEQ